MIAIPSRTISCDPSRETHCARSFPLRCFTAVVRCGPCGLVEAAVSKEFMFLFLRLYSAMTSLLHDRTIRDNKVATEPELFILFAALLQIRYAISPILCIYVIFLEMRASACVCMCDVCLTMPFQCYLN